MNRIETRSIAAKMMLAATLAAPMSALTALPSTSVAQTAGQDMKSAGTDTKDAAKSTGSATKKVAKKTGSGTKTIAKKTGSGTKKAAVATKNKTENVGDAIAGKPATH